MGLYMKKENVPQNTVINSIFAHFFKSVADTFKHTP